MLINKYAGFGNWKNYFILKLVVLQRKSLTVELYRFLLFILNYFFAQMCTLNASSTAYVDNGKFKHQLIKD